MQALYGTSTENLPPWVCVNPLPQQSPMNTASHANKLAETSGEAGTERKLRHHSNMKILPGAWVVGAAALMVLSSGVRECSGKAEVRVAFRQTFACCQTNPNHDQGWGSHQMRQTNRPANPSQVGHARR